MGVDAKMFIASDKIYTGDELIYLSYRLGDAVGSNIFMLFDDEYKILNSNIEYLPDSLPKAKQVIEVNLSGRYYGEGYERGNLWDYIAVAIWIEENFAIPPYYGGDSSDYLELFDDAARKKLIKYWAKAGHIPYRDRQERHTYQPTCPRCKVLATQFGYGGNYASWSCLGCGKTWQWKSETGVVEGKREY